MFAHGLCNFLGIRSGGFFLHIGNFLSTESKIKRLETRAAVDSIRTPHTFFQKNPDGPPQLPPSLKSPSMAGE